MITSKSEYKYYLEQDKLALNYDSQVKFPGFKDEIWKFEILLRKNEYVTNCLKSRMYLPYKLLIKYNTLTIVIYCEK